MFLPVDSKHLRTSTSRSRLESLRSRMLFVEHLKHKDNGRPIGRLHSDAQVSTRARKHQKLYTLALVCV